MVVVGVSFVGVQFAGGFDLGSSLILSLALCLQMLFGIRVWILLVKSSSVSSIELIGAGVAVGTLLAAAVSFLAHLINLRIPFVALLVPAVGILVLSWLTQNQEKPSIQLSRVEDLFIIAGLPMVGIALSTLDALLYCITYFVGVAFFSYFLRRHNQSKGSSTLTLSYLYTLCFVGLVAVSAVVSRVFISVSNRPSIYRRTIGIDQLFDEAQSFSVSSFGFRDNIFLAGFPMKGHFLPHLWAGDISIALDSPRFMSPVFTGQIVGVLGIVAIVYAISIRLFDSPTAAILSSICLIFQASLWDQLYLLPAPRMSNAMSLLWFALFVLVLFLAMENKLKKPYLVAIATFACLPLAKFHWALFALAIMGGLGILEFITKRAWKLLLASLISGLVFLTEYFLVLRGLNAYDLVSASFSGALLVGLIAILVLRHLGIVPLFGTRSERAKPLLKMLVIGWIVFIPLIWILSGTNQSGYFFSCIFILGSVFHGYIIKQSLHHLSSSKPVLVVVLFLGLLAGYGTALIYAHNFYSLLASKYNRKFHLLLTGAPDFSILIATAGLTVLATVYLLTRKSATHHKPTNKRLTIISIFAACAFAANIGVLVGQLQKPYIVAALYGETDPSSTLVMTADQISVGNWLTHHSGAKDVVATNFYCKAEIRDGDRVPRKLIDCRFRNDLAWISGLAHRKVFVEAPIFTQFGPGNPLGPDDAQRYNSAFQFADQPTVQLHEYFTTKGIKWFVIDKRQTTTRTWTPYANNVFENQTFIVLRIA
jgi:hypothetical protein